MASTNRDDPLLFSFPFFRFSLFPGGFRGQRPLVAADPTPEAFAARLSAGHL